MANVDDYFEGFEVKKNEYRQNFNKELDNQIKTALLNSRIGSVIIVGSRLGGGKTTLVIKNLYAFTPSINPISFIFLSPTHRNSENAFNTFKDVFEEDWNNLGLDIEELKGKKHYCIDKDYMKYASRLGIQLSAFCDLCSYKDTVCEFWSKFRYLSDTSTSFRGVQAFLGNIVNVMVEKGKYTDVVIDENPKSTLFQRCMVAAKSLRRYAAFLSNMMGDYKQEDRYKLLVHLVERLHSLLLYLDDKKKFWVIHRSIYDKIREDDLLSIETCDLMLESIKIARDMAVKNKHTRGLPRRLDIFETLSKIIRKMIDGGMDYDFFHYSFEITKTAMFLRFCDLSVIQNKMVRTWILDATTSPVFYKQIFTDSFYDIKIIDDTSIIKNNFLVLQLNDAKYGMTSLTRYDHERNEWKPTQAFADLFDLTCRIINKNEGKQVLIVSRKAQGVQKLLKENLMERFKDKAIYAHDKPKFDASDEKVIETANIALDYYSVSRGVNFYRKYSVCILFGGAFPNKETVKRESVISGISKDVLTKTQTEDEMNQSWGRIRPKQTSTIYVLSNIELGFVNEFNTFKCTMDEMRRFIENGFAITKEKIEMLVNDKDLLKHLFLGKDIPPRYLSFQFAGQYFPAVKQEAEKMMDSIMAEIGRTKSGIDASELKEKFHFDIKDFLFILESKKKIGIVTYKRTFTSRKMKTRIVIRGKDDVDFDAFNVQCENTEIDGKRRPGIVDEIIYTLRFVLENTCNVTSLLKALKAKPTSKSNRENIEVILTELVTRGTLKKEVKGKESTYSFNERVL